MERFLVIMLMMVILGVNVQAEQLKFKEDFVRRLAAAVPSILKDQDSKTGRFGKGIWVVNDQNSMYPLAVAWATKSDDNPYYHDPKVLKAIVAAGDALAADANDKGQWEFRKKDGSTWGPTYMPWAYYRWLRSFTLIKDGMSPEDRKRWENALTLGYTGISQTQLTRLVNIPTYHAMSLYLAGKTFDRPEWCKQAKEFLARVIAAQDPNGYWSENFGPVVRYNTVYTEALAAYHSISGDEMVLPALARAAKLHASFLYPDGSLVETIDERNPYHPGLFFPNAGMTLSPEGRGLVLQQIELLGNKPIAADTMAGYIMDGQEGTTIPTAAQDDHRTFMLDDGKAMVRRTKPWFICMSAYHCPIRESRWIQDRQNLVSIFHDKCGLIVGGGNTKLQPLWSNFTVGDISLLKDTPGDTAPDFLPKGPLFHVPIGASLKVTDPIGLALKYGEEDCSIEVEPVDDSTLRIHLKATARSGQPVAAHLTLIPHLGKSVRTESGTEKSLGDEAFTISGEDAGGWIAHMGWRLTLPREASVTWPVLPHNPYRKDGHATPSEARLVVSLPFSPNHGEYVLTLSVE